MGSIMSVRSSPISWVCVCVCKQAIELWLAWLSRSYKCRSHLFMNPYCMQRIKQSTLQAMNIGQVNSAHMGQVSAETPTSGKVVIPKFCVTSC